MTTCLTAQKTETCTQGIWFLDEKKRSVEIESDHHDEDFIRGVEPSVELLDDAAKTRKTNDPSMSVIFS